jgi:hypothetical protein
MDAKTNLSSLLSQGDISAIAREIGISPGAASAAIRRGNPGHKAVRAALKLAEDSGALAAAQQLAKLAPLAQAA